MVDSSIRARAGVRPSGGSASRCLRAIQSMLASYSRGQLAAHVYTARGMVKSHLAKHCQSRGNKQWASNGQENIP